MSRRWRLRETPATYLQLSPVLAATAPFEDVCITERLRRDLRAFRPFLDRRTVAERRCELPPVLELADLPLEGHALGIVDIDLAFDRTAIGTLCHRITDPHCAAGFVVLDDNPGRNPVLVGRETAIESLAERRIGRKEQCGRG